MAGVVNPLRPAEVPAYLHPTPSGAERVPVVDLRGAAARAGRRVLLGALHLPAAEWADRSLEFPPRRSRFALIVSRRDAASVVRAGLIAAHFGEPAEVVDADADADADAGVGALSGADEAGNARGALVIADDAAANAAATAAGAAARFEAFLARAPPERVGVAGEAATDAADRRSQPRLWLPSPLLATALETRGGWLAAAAAAAAAAGAPLRVLDAGCGTARNAVFLAKRLGGGDAGAARLRVVAVDNRRAIVQKVAKFAARSGCGGAVECIEADIDDFIEAAEERGRAARCAGANAAGAVADADSDKGDVAGRFDVALFFRFTHKPALARLPTLLRRHALVAAEAFHVTAPHPAERSQQLEEGELAALLAGPGLRVETLVEELAAAEDGRPLLRVVCRVEHAT